jgi:hypothetical protein
MAAATNSQIVGCRLGNIADWNRTPQTSELGSSVGSPEASSRYRHSCWQI